MSRILTRAVLQTLQRPLGAAAFHNKSRIGNREVVGFGLNGQASYLDKTCVPMPAIRYREETPDIKILREKEKGDWRKLSMEEKKALYRHNFCQTFSEIAAPTGEWKGVVGWALFLSSLSIWMYMLMKKFVYPPPTPSLSDESQKAQLRRMLDLRINPIDGLASKWDYENNRWK